MKARPSVFVICVEVIIYLLLYNLHDSTFTGCVAQLLEKVLRDARFFVVHTCAKFLNREHKSLFTPSALQSTKIKDKVKAKGKIKFWELYVTIPVRVDHTNLFKVTQWSNSTFFAQESLYTLVTSCGIYLIFYQDQFFFLFLVFSNTEFYKKSCSCYFYDDMTISSSSLMIVRARRDL